MNVLLLASFSAFAALTPDDRDTAAASLAAGAPCRAVRNTLQTTRGYTCATVPSASTGAACLDRLEHGCSAPSGCGEDSVWAPFDLRVPDDYATVQAAVDAAADDDHVCVAGGTWVGSVDLGAKNLVLVGAEGREGTTLVASGVRALTIDGGQDEHTVIDGFTLTGGDATRGGGFALLHAGATLWNVRVTGNAARIYGAGGYVEDAVLDAWNVQFDGNVSDYSGGGLMLYASDARIVGGVFSDNEVGADAASFSGNAYGGGLWMSEGTFELDDVVAERNYLYTTYVGGGAGITIGSQVTLDADGLLLADNVADGGRGGALHFGNGATTATLRNVTMAGNTALNGGAMFAQPDSHGSTQVVLLDAIVAHNRADDDVGGLWAYGGATVRLAGVAFWDDRDADGEDHERDTRFRPGDAAVIYPGFLRYDAALDSTDWDLHLQPGSACRNAGAGPRREPDGTAVDYGSYGGGNLPLDWYADDDGDGMWDGWEVDVGLDPTVDDAASDDDGDGLAAAEEMTAGTWPLVADSDGDGVDDGAEVIAGTNPLDPAG